MILDLRRPSTVTSREPSVELARDHAHDATIASAIASPERRGTGTAPLPAVRWPLTSCRPQSRSFGGTPWTRAAPAGPPAGPALNARRRVIRAFSPYSLRTQPLRSRYTAVRRRSSTPADAERHGAPRSAPPLQTMLPPALASSPCLQPLPPALASSPCLQPLPRALASSPAAGSLAARAGGICGRHLRAASARSVGPQLFPAAVSRSVCPQHGELLSRDSAVTEP